MYTTVQIGFQRRAKYRLVLSNFVFLPCYKFFISSICACAISISVFHYNRVCNRVFDQPPLSRSLMCCAAVSFIFIISYQYYSCIQFQFNLSFCFLCHVFISLSVFCVLWFHSTTVFDRIAAIIVRTSQVNFFYFLVAGICRSHFVITIYFVFNLLITLLSFPKF